MVVLGGIWGGGGGGAGTGAGCSCCRFGMVELIDAATFVVPLVLFLVLLFVVVVLAVAVVAVAVASDGNEGRATVSVARVDLHASIVVSSVGSFKHPLRACAAE